MQDLLNSGLGWLADQQRQHMSRTVTYLRGLDTVEIDAIKGRSDTLETNEMGVTYRIQADDWLIRPEVLVIGGQTILPKAGDRIRESIGGRTYLYEVLPGNGAPAYERRDDHRFRIHTKLVSTT